jgi:cbb3-type cytochrome oxidase cytochrome c subunit
MNGSSIVERHKCEACHKMVGPSAQTIDEILERKAPELFYAGSKYKKDWLVEYMQNPTQNWPAGVVYLNFIEHIDGQDKIGKTDQCESKLSLKEARPVADYLMTLKDKNMKTGQFKEQKISTFLVELTMQKQNGCHACHIFPGKGGGVSGPTFERIGQKLNPDWIYSFLKNPQYWDPRVWMPNNDFGERTLQLITNYLSQLK